MPAWLVFALSATVVAAAGMRLARDGDTIAARTGLGGLWVGAILVAAVTSLPELTTDLSAVLQHHPALAVGDLFGSNMANMAILAGADLSVRSTRMLTRVTINQALVGTLGIVLMAIAAIGVLAGKELSALGLSWPTLAIGFAYLAGMRLLHHNRSGPPFETTADLQESRERARPLRPAIIGFALCAVVILGAAPFLASSAAAIAVQLGLSTGFVGLLLVAVATSLPELAVTVESLRAGSYDLSVGNLVGSNCFNMFALVPLDLVQGPGSILAQADASLMVGALFGMLLTALALLDILNKSESRVWFLEPGPGFMLLAYTAGVWLSYTAARV